MSKKRILISAVVMAVLAALAYLQFREWRRFNWHVFWEQTGHAKLLLLLSAVALIYLTYPLRALRWKIFLKPVCHASVENLTPPTVIGFTALALLGRPGEFVRPYLIARKENLSLSSQMAVWTVERIFDTGSFTVMIALTLLLAPTLRSLPYFEQFRRFGFVLVAVVIGLSLFAVLVRRKSEGVAAWVENKLAFAPRFGRRLARRLRSFGEGLNTIHDFSSFLQLVALSLLIWFLIALAYRQAAHAFPGPLRHLTVSHVVLLMGFAIAGSTVQLPVVGGGSQLMSIAALAHVFNIPNELAVSCGITLWLVTFMSVVPLGLVLAHREHVSLARLSAEGQREKEHLGV